MRSSLVVALLIGACAPRADDVDAGSDVGPSFDGGPRLDVATPVDAPSLRTTRPIAPLSTATVTSRRPTLRWSLAPDTDGARVELCGDRACTMILTTMDVTGTSTTPSTDLPIGVVYWRIYGRMGAVTSTAPSPTWQFIVGARTAPVDTSWGTTLDVNGDGYADLAVGAYGASSNAGRVHVYLGSASGLGTAPSPSLSGPGGFFGNSVASAGDVNGDGYADLVVGTNAGMSGAGYTYVYLGSVSGLGASPATTLTSPDGPGDGFGGAVVGVGDVNGDGYADLAVGAPWASGSVGRAYIYLGSASGLRATPATTLTGPDGTDGYFGAVGGAGDVNGDGYADLAVVASSSRAHRAYIYLGGASELGTTPATTISYPAGSAVLGVLPGAGDVNGDGYADLAASFAELSRDGAAYAYVHLGSASGLDATPATTLTSPDERVGPSSMGDLDGDGYDDLVVAEYAWSSNTGRVHVYLGSAAGLGTTPATTLTGPDGPNGGFGKSSVADVNGDGRADLAVGAGGVSSGTGRAHVYLGGASGLGTTPATSLTGPDGAGGYFGTVVAISN